MSFVKPVPTYTEFLQTVSDIQVLIFSFQSEIKLHIIRHTYPYTVQISVFNFYNHIHIYTLQDLLYLHHKVQQLLILPF